MNSSFGLIGIGVMGRNLGLNILDNGISLSTYDINQENLQNLREQTSTNQLQLHSSLEDFTRSLETPRKIMLMVTAGKVIDDLIEDLLPYLSSGDIIIDGGNSNFEDTERRINFVNERDILYLGVGISGGAKGARHGPSMMPGGNKEAWVATKSYLQRISAKTSDDVPCCQYIGRGGSGHFVKTIHNGIEYSDMQLIAESYHLLKDLAKYDAKQVSKTFAEWNEAELASYLIEITAHIFNTYDPDTGKPMVDVILDSASQKGTGKWSVHSALDLGTPSTLISTAVFQRFISSLKQDRQNLSELYPNSSSYPVPEDFSILLRNSLFLSKLFSYVQGFNLLAKASTYYEWDLDLSRVALVWSAGCIIRSQLLERIQKLFSQYPDLTNILSLSNFNEEIKHKIKDLRQICQIAIFNGIPVPGFSSSISYFDSYTTSILPANLIQAQRDYFGSHGFLRTDDSTNSKHHADWSS